jgi:hypothetical protein
MMQYASFSDPRHCAYAIYEIGTISGRSELFRVCRKTTAQLGLSRLARRPVYPFQPGYENDPAAHAFSVLEPSHGRLWQRAGRLTVSC